MRINFFAPINRLGTGIHAFNLIRAFERRGHDVSLIPPMGQVRVSNEDTTRWLSKKDRLISHTPSVMIFDPTWLYQFSGRPRLGFAVFETDRLDPAQLEAVCSCDGVLVPSDWGRRVLESHGVPPWCIRVVNEGFEPADFPLVPAADRNSQTFTFCHVGKVEERKGTLQIVRCFAKELASDHAKLEILSSDPFGHGGMQKLVELLMELGFSVVEDHSQTAVTWRKGGLTIRLWNERPESTAWIYTISDCGIYPSKGEGWGLPILECIVSGVPAIVGSWSGHSEFITMGYPQELAFDRSRSEVANDGLWFRGDRGSWHVVDDDQVRYKIRWAFENARALRKEERWTRFVDGTRDRFTWDNAAGMLELAVRWFEAEIVHPKKRGD